MALFSFFGKDDNIWYRDENLECPRDNVILEYGIFLKRLNRKSVIIVREEKTKLPTDLLGLTYEVASKETPQNIVSHLKGLYSCPFPLLPSSEINISADPKVVTRQMQDPLPKEWHQRVLYFGVEGARRWLSVSDEFKGMSSYNRSSKILDLVEELEVRTFVSFGPGDASVDKSILVKIRNNVPWIHYIPVDISDGLLKHSINSIHEDYYVPIGVFGDFEDSLDFIKRQLDIYARSPKLFGLIGNTLGNLDKSEQDFIEGLRWCMEPEDRLLLEVRIKGKNWQWEKDGNTNHESYNNKWRYFIATGIARRENIPIEEIVENFEDYVEFERGDSDVPKSTESSVRICNSNTKKLVLNIRTYDFVSLISWLQKMNFNIEGTKDIYFDNEIHGVGILLLSLRQ